MFFNFFYLALRHYERGGVVYFDSIWLSIVICFYVVKSK